MAADSKNPIDDHPWPKKSDRLFAKRPKVNPSQSTGSLAFDQVMESMRPEPDYCYREGYYEAARVLATEISKSEHADLYFPMVFCFRHYVELSLKSLLQVYAELVDEDVPEDLRTQHNLMRLWNKTKLLIERADSRHRQDDDTLRNVGRNINELNDVDKSSQRFRYATDRAGRAGENGLPTVRLDQFMKTMKNLESFFEACRTQAEVWQEWKDDAEAIARSEMPDEEGW